MKHINVIEKDGKEIEIRFLPKEEKERFVLEWNEKALAAVGYALSDEVRPPARACITGCPDGYEKAEEN